MIDFENLIFTEITDAVTAEFPNIEYSSIEQATPKIFPAFAFEMLNNPVNINTFDGKEYSANPKFKATAWTANNDKETCKRILSVADGYMSSKGFIRTVGPQKTTNSDPTTCQMYIIYDKNTIDADGNVYIR